MGPAARRGSRIRNFASACVAHRARVAPARIVLVCKSWAASVVCVWHLLVLHGALQGLSRARRHCGTQQSHGAPRHVSAAFGPIAVQLRPKAGPGARVHGKKNVGDLPTSVSSTHAWTFLSLSWY